MNYETDKFKSMNEDMEDFLNQIPLGNSVGKVEKFVQTENCSIEGKADSKNGIEKKEKDSWIEKEEQLKFLLILQKKSLIQSRESLKKPNHHNVPAKFWEHQTIAWTLWSRPLPPRPGHRESNLLPNPNQSSFQNIPTKHPNPIPNHFTQNPSHFQSRRLLSDPNKSLFYIHLH